MHSSLPDSSVHGILQAGNRGGLPWASSWPRDRTQVSCIADGFFTISVTREAKYLYNIIWLEGSDFKEVLDFIKCDSF